MQVHSIQAFGPDRWLKFPNQFPERNLVWKRVVGRFSIPMGLTNFGLCGGLAATAIDIFHSGRFPPRRTTPPSSCDDPILFNWLKQRQVESISLKDFWKYLKGLFTGPNSDKVEIRQAWSQIKASILLDQPVLVGLQKAKVDAWYKIHQVARIVHNHQVVIWGFEETENEVTLQLYDPSHPELDKARLSFDLDSGKITSCHPMYLGPVFAFFKTSYTPKTPPQEME